MKKFIISLIILFLIVQKGSGHSCVQLSLFEQYLNSEYVFRGKVKSVEYKGGASLLTIDLLENFKENVTTDKVVFYSVYGVSKPFKIGKTYLFYGSNNADAQPFDLSHLNEPYQKAIYLGLCHRLQYYYDSLAEFMLENKDYVNDRGNFKAYNYYPFKNFSPTQYMNFLNQRYLHELRNLRTIKNTQNGKLKLYYLDGSLAVKATKEGGQFNGNIVVYYPKSKYDKKTAKHGHLCIKGRIKANQFIGKFIYYNYKIGLNQLFWLKIYYKYEWKNGVNHKHYIKTKKLWNSRDIDNEKR